MPELELSELEYSWNSCLLHHLYFMLFGYFFLFYFLKHLSCGYWRSIYPTSPLSSFVEITQIRLREYFVPEIYLKEREKRKIEIKLKETEELREVWHKWSCQNHLKRSFIYSFSSDYLIYSITSISQFMKKIQNQTINAEMKKYFLIK